MIAVTPNMRVVAAIKPVDFRKGIDGLSQLCRSLLAKDPRDGTIFVFRCRSAKSIKLLMYDGQGFWLAQKRLSFGRFHHWPTSVNDTASATLLAEEFMTLLCAGNRKLAYARAPLLWNKVELGPSTSGVTEDEDFASATGLASSTTAH